MADIELVIKIPEEAYKHLLEEQKLPNGLDLEYFIIHGRPLPKNLISRDFMKEMGATCIAKRISTGELVAISSIDELTEELGKIKADKEYEAKVITRGNCMKCGKELTEGLFFCKECENKAESEE